LHDNLKPFGKLPKPILTPTSKAAAFEHDEEQTPEQLIASGVCTRDEWEKIASLSHLIFSIGQDIYRQKGWILVDTKYEFGRDNLGHLFLMDEVHTPDSSRLWVASTYQQRHDAGLPPEMFDKEFIRRFLIEQGFSGYGDVPEVPKEMLFKLALLYLDVAESLLGRHLNSKDCEPELRL
jgi:phosphoribosylaminoimidazole-succinocarboxamide synthase